jgi:RNA polymerase sigma-70 factor (ECF subfamily)
MTDRVERVYRSVLVVRCQAGDRAAFEELVELYQPRLRYFLASMAGEHAADDLLQEVWFDVFRGVARLADPGAFAAWLYRIARHRALGELRKRRQPLSSLEGIDLPAEEPEEDDFSAEDAQRVHAALIQLPLEHREVLLLRFFEAMTYEDIAAVTGCQLGTVRSRIHYAKRALRRVMEGVLQNE